MSTAQKRRYSGAFDRKKPNVATDEDTTVPEEEPFDEFDDAYMEFEEFEPGVDEAPTDTTQTGTDETEVETETPVPVARPDNPWVGKVQAVPDSWGTSIHERENFAPSMKKDYHGVWGTKNVSEVRDWVSAARDSINADDDLVVASRPGSGGGHDFLVDMDGRIVGYISGRKVTRGTRPRARHVAVHVNNKGYVDAASPSTPEIF